MKKIISGIVGGIAGAAALNILHQAAAQLDHDAPRVDLIGEEALSEGLRKTGFIPPHGRGLFLSTLTADVLCNAAYFSLTGFAKKKHLVGIGTLTGLAAGIGALTLTKPMGLSDAPVTRTDKTKLMTVVWYTFGGLVAGTVMLTLRKK